jgi:hypothetical protein
MVSTRLSAHSFTVSVFLDVEKPERETDQWLSPTAEINNAVCLIKKDIFTSFTSVLTEYVVGIVTR